MSYTDFDWLADRLHIDRQRLHVARNFHPAACVIHRQDLAMELVVLADGLRNLGILRPLVQLGELLHPTRCWRLP
ncbi:hypothetical protein ACVIHI_000102 [Bradyrhizobium sp. USDA 4524]|uniref:hypothetical protein n=1 Tax=unclassified Bradyrhizobium TaxID=2631580 RepID=UPI00209EFD36|nr:MULTISPECIES: hypothetical protein [unclassified Bradyrhizobium]MCP1838533.1 hypothetical protein [Bradyrhizobium sp. USDA 4538]MCP1899098.1 hypothetical protein [Bradyrhizobium sp. USDA 4537]MCP1986789.1 hypothetical protein [Bradyrhizobium sp. USDA 4539]